MHEQQILICTGVYTITDLRCKKIILEILFITGDFDMTNICKVT